MFAIKVFFKIQTVYKIVVLQLIIWNLNVNTSFVKKKILSRDRLQHFESKITIDTPVFDWLN